MERAALYDLVVKRVLGVDWNICNMGEDYAVWERYEGDPYGLRIECAGESGYSLTAFDCDVCGARGTVYEATERYLSAEYMLSAHLLKAAAALGVDAQ